MSTFLIVLIVLAVIAFIILILSLKIVRESTAMVIERLGRYNRTLNTGVHMILPFFDKVAGGAINMKERIADFQPQAVITKDNVTMQIDTVVYFQVTDPKLFTYGVDRPISAIENLTATTLRNIVGEMELDETLTSREVVNTKMRAVLDEATDPWGIKINRVELKNILPPQDIRNAMEKQMRAERERRESILIAEGEKKSKILIAEGEKEAAILKAEAKKIELESEALGRAEAIRLINEAKPSAEYIALQGYEALKVLAKGEATKIIVPSELQNVATLATAVTETLTTNKANLESSKKTK